jgi:hypothetical protein
LTIEGLRKILVIKASVNNGLSDQLKESFPGIIPVIRPLVKCSEIKDPNWLAGFVSGEGCFSVHIFTSAKSRLGKAVQLKFTITQHRRDLKLMNSLIKYLDCGIIVLGKEKSSGEFIVTSFEDISSKIIPFFNKYQLQGIKVKNYDDFKKVVLLMEKKVWSL